MTLATKGSILSLPDRVDPLRTAFFLDVDGTLVAIEDSPDRVSLEPHVAELLVKLDEASRGAVGIVTGRSLLAADALLHPMTFPLAAEHGLIRRDKAGAVHAAPAPPHDALERIEERLNAFLARHAGLLLEVKSGSLTLHFRLRPDLEHACAEAVAAAIDGIPGYCIGMGKMVFEARPAVADKGTAVAAFMQEAPFAGRTPLFAGDDITDEDAIAEVNRLGGFAIKVGDAPTSAPHRFLERTDFLRWLAAALPDR